MHSECIYESQLYLALAREKRNNAVLKKIE